MAASMSPEGGQCSHDYVSAKPQMALASMGGGASGGSSKEVLNALC